MKIIDKNTYLIIGLFLITLLTSIFNSCQLNNRGVFFLDDYNQKDSLQIQKYILFSTYERKRLNYGIVRSDSDSLFEIFKNSLIKLDLPIDLDSKSKNIVNQRIINNYHSSYNVIDRIDYDSIISYLGEVNLDENILLPLIKFNYMKSHDASSAGVDVYYIGQLTIVFFIIKNNNVIYANEAFHSERVDSEYHPYAYSDFNIPIPQEDWDNLVKKIMREYTERLK